MKKNEEMNYEVMELVARAYEAHSMLKLMFESIVDSQILDEETIWAVSEHIQLADAYFEENYPDNMH